ncbi:MAG: ORF6N domain-containing protein, partial [Ruminococcus sp.]|nr:ORF6N domain-containing protein [Ruminococcus sp.]
MYELINDVPLKIKEYNRQRVVTFRDIDTIHNRPEGTAVRNFRKNREHFIENEDYFIVNQVDEIRRLGITRVQAGTPSSVILITKSSYLMLMKSFTDDLAWSLQRQLVKSYFKAKELDKQSLYIVSDIDTVIERAVNKAVVEAVSETVKVLALYMKNSTDNIQVKNKIPCQKRNYNNGKISNLLQNIRQKVDDMIISGKYSCQKIADFIKENTDTEISYMTVSVTLR